MQPKLVVFPLGSFTRVRKPIVVSYSKWVWFEVKSVALESNVGTGTQDRYCFLRTGVSASSSRRRTAIDAVRAAAKATLSGRELPKTPVRPGRRRQGRAGHEQASKRKTEVKSTGTENGERNQLIMSEGVRLLFGNLACKADYKKIVEARREDAKLLDLHAPPGTDRNKNKGWGIGRVPSDQTHKLLNGTILRGDVHGKRLISLIGPSSEADRKSRDRRSDRRRHRPGQLTQSGAAPGRADFESKSPLTPAEVPAFSTPERTQPSASGTTRRNLCSQVCAPTARSFRRSAEQLPPVNSGRCAALTPSGPGSWISS